MTGVQTCALPISLGEGEDGLIGLAGLKGLDPNGIGLVGRKGEGPQIGRASCRERV